MVNNGSIMIHDDYCNGDSWRLMVIDGITIRFSNVAGWANPQQMEIYSWEPSL